MSFLPTDIAGCVCWLDPTDSGTVTLVSGNVSQVTDKSGNSHNATQTVGGNRPGYSTLTPSGLSALSMASNTFMNITVPTLAQPYTIFAAFKNSTSGAYVHDTSARVAQLYANASSLALAGDFLFGYAGGAGAIGDGTNAALNQDLYTSFVVNGASSKYYVNGSLTGSGNPGTAGIATNMFLGCRFSSTFFLTGYIAQFIIYNSALSDADRQSVESYLNNLVLITNKTITGSKLSDVNTFGTDSFSSTLGLVETKYTSTNTFGTDTLLLSKFLTETKYSNTNTFGTDSLSYRLSSTKFSDTDTFGTDVLIVDVSLAGLIMSSSNIFHNAHWTEAMPVPYGRNIVQRRREGCRTVDIQTLPADGNSVFRFY